MSFRINSNVQSISAQNALTKTSDNLAKSMERLSTGKRINSAADDAAGLGISEHMQSQIRGLGQAQRNIQDGVSMVQTAEGNLDQVHSMLQRVRELAVQYKNGTLGTADKAAIQSEVDQLHSEIDRIGTSANFNGISLLDGTSASISFQVGANDSDVVNVALTTLSTSVGTSTYCLDASDTLSQIDASIGNVSKDRAGLGAVQNRLENAMAVQATYQENLTAAESQITDVDMAAEMSTLTKNQILQQAGTAMLAQANSAPQAVLRLLQ